MMHEEKSTLRNLLDNVSFL